MPESYQTPAELASRAGAAPTPAPVELATWWKSLNDPQLDSLVDRAVDSNLDLSMAASRLLAARAEVGVVVSRQLPSADVSRGLARGTGTNSTKGRVSPPLNAATNTSGLQEITHVVGFDALWEVDLFGRLRRQAEAAMADAQAASDLHNQVLVTLVADVARAYVHVRSLQRRLEVAQRMIDVAGKTVELSQAKFKRGMVNELDAALAQRELATVQARIQPLQAELAAAKRTVALLLGQFPEELNSELGESRPLPTAPAAIDTGLPGDLLLHRPDIRQAESELVASNARIGVATAAMYPQITLTGGIGYQGQGLGRLPVGLEVHLLRRAVGELADPRLRRHLLLDRCPGLPLPGPARQLPQGRDRGRGRGGQRAHELQRRAGPAGRPGPRPGRRAALRGPRQQALRARADGLPERARRRAANSSTSRMPTP